MFERKPNFGIWYMLAIYILLHFTGDALVIKLSLNLFETVESCSTNVQYIMAETLCKTMVYVQINRAGVTHTFSLYYCSE